MNTMNVVNTVNTVNAGNHYETFRPYAPVHAFTLFMHASFLPVVMTVWCKGAPFRRVSIRICEPRRTSRPRAARRFRMPGHQNLACPAHPNVPDIRKGRGKLFYVHTQIDNR
jgi:hypothetical protein